MRENLWHLLTVAHVRLPNTGKSDFRGTPREFLKELRKCRRKKHRKKATFSTWSQLLKKYFLARNPYPKGSEKKTKNWTLIGLFLASLFKIIRIA